MAATAPVSFSIHRDPGQPPPPLVTSGPIMAMWQALAITAIVLGGWYLGWRWTHSLNADAYWLAVPMAVAETLAYVGLLLFVHALWDQGQVRLRPPPASVGECDPAAIDPQRRIAVDVFICTRAEPVDLLRDTIRAARQLRVPPGVSVLVHVLDDGARPAVAALAAAEGANCLQRQDNSDFKAGNLRHGLENSNGDFLIICHADTLLFPGFLEQTLGHFRDPEVAFVQTPLWFRHDPPRETLAANWRRRFGLPGRLAAWLAGLVTGPVTVGADPFSAEARLFHDIVQPRHGRLNAGVSCGAASIHRREAIMSVALRAWTQRVTRAAPVAPAAGGRRRRGKARAEALAAQARWQAAQAIAFTPYRHHVADDLHSTIMLHQDRARRWKSIMHPAIQSCMLAAPDFGTWAARRWKRLYGSLDIFIRDNPVFGGGLSLRQRLIYLSGFWQSLSGLWLAVLVLVPIIHLFSGVAPVNDYGLAYFAHLLPFLMVLELALMFGLWGRSAHVGRAQAVAGFALSLQALWQVLRGKPFAPLAPPANPRALVRLHQILIGLGLLAIAYAAVRLWLAQQGQYPTSHTPGSLIANGGLVLFNNAAFGRLVRASGWRPALFTGETDR